MVQLNNTVIKLLKDLDNPTSNVLTYLLTNYKQDVYFVINDNMKKVIATEKGMTIAGVGFALHTLCEIRIIFKWKKTIFLFNNDMLVKKQELDLTRIYKSKDVLDSGYKRNKINKWEYDFYIDVYSKTSLSDKQLFIVGKINKKL